VEAIDEEIKKAAGPSIELARMVEVQAMNVMWKVGVLLLGGEAGVLPRRS